MSFELLDVGCYIMLILCILTYVLSFFGYYYLLLRILKTKRIVLKEFHKDGKANVLFYIHLLFKFVNYTSSFGIVYFLCKQLSDEYNIAHMVIGAAVLCVIGELFVTFIKHTLSSNNPRHLKHA